MADSRFLAGARQLLDLAERQMTGFEPNELASLLAVALGMRIGTEMFPRDPGLALAQAVVVINVTARHTQRQLTQETIMSCEGRA